MKIALLGYGKMGKAIEEIATKRNHSIVLRANSDVDLSSIKADVAIDFSTPESAFNNISNAICLNIPVVSGTTGWLDKYNDIENLVSEKNGAFLYASNFSLGVNLFFELNDYLAKILSKISQYKPSIEEIHHIHKLDAPSGTAISLAESIIKHQTNYTSWALDKATEDNQIAITAKRIAEVPGTHYVTYTGPTDKISISHEAYSRQGFANGAVIAAEWLIDKKGIFNMKDVLNLNN